MDNKIRFEKHIFGDLAISSQDLIGIFGPGKIEGEGLSDSEIHQRICKPLGTEPLSRLVKNKRKILIVTDDNTRNTPLKRILPVVLAELHAAGVHNENITILIGLGTHRPMTQSEILEKFGEKISGQYNIVNHAWDDPSSLISMDTVDLGFEVVINKLVQKSDFIISIGSIVPHATAGYSGGGKTIMPGICGEKTIEDTHWTALNYDMEQIIGKYDNQVRRSIVQVCRKAGLGFIVNSILFNGDAVFDIVAGDVEQAHKRGTEICKSLYGAPIPEKADIVVAEAYPTDIDLRQAIKAICSADVACKDGGVIILPAECSEGIAPQFPNFIKYGFSDPQGLFKEVEDGKFSEKLLAYTLVAIGRIISGRKKAILVSPNISRQEAKQLGFHWAANLQSAWETATDFTRNTSTIVLKNAGELLPLIPQV